MKTKFLIAILFAVAFAAIFIKQQFAYPQAWYEIHSGMSKKEVYQHLDGPPRYWGEQGAVWTENKTIQRQEMNIIFEENKVSQIEVNEYIGTEGDFIKFHPWY